MYCKNCKYFKEGHFDEYDVRGELLNWSLLREVLLRVLFIVRGRLLGERRERRRDANASLLFMWSFIL